MTLYRSMMVEISFTSAKRQRKHNNFSGLKECITFILCFLNTKL